MNADDFRRPTTMVLPWLLWFFIAVHLFLLDGLLSGLAVPVPDLAVVFCLHAALFARSTALPGLLCCAALGRSIFVAGGLGVHLLVLGIPIALLLPLRLVFFRRNLLWQAVVAGFIAWSLPHLELFFLRFTPDAGVTPTSAEPLAAMLLAPPAVWLLARLPPLPWFTERSE